MIAGGGIFWPVYGSRIDTVVLTTNAKIAARFSQPRNLLGVDLAVRPGGVQLDQFPKLIGDPVIFAFGQSDEGISPLNLNGGTISEDRAANAVLYGKELTNLAVLSGKGGGQKPLAADSFLAALAFINFGTIRRRRIRTSRTWVWMTHLDPPWLAAVLSTLYL